MKSMRGQSNLLVYVLVMSIAILCTVILCTTDKPKHIVLVLAGVGAFTLFVISSNKYIVMSWLILLLTAVNRGKVIYLSPFSGEPITLSLYWIALFLFTGWLVYTQQPKPLIPPPAQKPVVLFMLLILTGFFVSWYQSIVFFFSIHECIHLFTFIAAVIFWNAIIDKQNEASIQTIFSLFFLIGVFEAILAIFETLFGISMSFWAASGTLYESGITNLVRARGSVGSYTGLGNYLAVLFPFCLAQYLYYKTWFRLICLNLIGLGLLLTFVRIAWIGVLLSTLCILLVSIRYKKVKLVHLALAFCALITTGSIISLVFHEKIILAFQKLLFERGDTLSSRMKTYAIAMTLMKDSHFLGIGLRNYNSVLVFKHWFSQAYVAMAHNSLIVILVEAGIAGLLFFIASYVSIWNICWASLRRIVPDSLYFFSTLGVIGSLISFAVCSMLNMTVDYPHTMTLLWNICAIGLASIYHSARKTGIS